MLHKNGQWVDIFSRANAIFDDNGVPVRVVGTHVDITDRRKTEKQLKKTTYDLRERLKELNCLYRISKLVNKENVTIEEIFQGIVDIIPPSWQYPEITCAQITIDGQSYKSDNFKETEWLQSQKIIVSEMKAGEVKVFYFEEKPEIDEGPFLKEERDLINAITLRIGHIFEEKKAEAEKGTLQSRLQQAQKMEAIGTLAGGIAHDFNNILGAIIGYTEMARDDSPKGSSVAQDLDKVLEASTRATDLVKQILAFSRQNDTEYIFLRPASIVNKAISMLRPTLPATIKITHDIDTETGLIFADPTQIHQIMLNLCTNAFHAMEETGGRLDVSLKEIDLCREDIIHEPHADTGTFQNQPNHFDLVITDQTMPGMTGIDLARRMLQIRPDIPVILCTGYSSIISERKVKSMGIREFAMKPLGKSDIAMLIRKVLDNKHLM